MSYLVAALAVILAFIARAGVRRPNRNRPVWAVALVGSELAGPLLIVSATVAIGVVAREWAGGPAGTVAAIAAIASTAMYLLALVRGLFTRPVIRAAVADAMATPPRIRETGVRGVLNPIPLRPRRLSIETVRYGEHERHLMDHFVGPGEGPRPALVYVHGGGWWRGRRQTQALPVRYLAARRGWHVFAPSYRLSPEVAVPGHLIDVKRSIAWIREHARELDVAPDFIAVAGGSTGGNIAALAALTAGDTSLQPGFEDADTSVQACLPFYGVHDMLRSDGSPLWPYLAKSVMQSDPHADPDAWRRASPIHVAGPDRPPFWIVHGGADTLVWPRLSRRLVAALEAEGGPGIEYLEVPWATHGFDFFSGPRGRLVAAATLAVLDDLYARHRMEIGS
jgi:acetyl esterase/lipase